MIGVGLADEDRNDDTPKCTCWLDRRGYPIYWDRWCPVHPGSGW